ncbi:MAG: type II toxin-antitoxin system prevent-host-death family antitoxin [Micrococcales bacterium]|nr:type II toxin-antitoxin system prevent-host-death family antitoxin [Micrococcales bacterium]
MTKTTVGAYEAKTHLSQLLDQVAAGHTITILRHGTPVARLTPVNPAAGGDPDEVVEAFRKARQGVRLGGLSVRELIDEGRQ